MFETIITETLVEELFKVFDEGFALRKFYISRKAFETDLQIRCRNYGIKLIFLEMSNLDQVGGKYNVDGNILTIFLPKGKEFTVQDVMSVLLHEYSHYLKEKRKPGEFNPTEINKTTNYVGLPEGFDRKYLQLRDSEEIFDYLEYLTQPHESSSQAFSIAYDVYEYNDELKPNNIGKPEQVIEKFLDEFYSAWEENFNNEYRLDEYLKSKKLNSGTETLFWFMGYLLMIKTYKYRQEEVSLKNKVSKIRSRAELLLNMIKKYYLRIAGIMNYDKKNKCSRITFRV